MPTTDGFLLLERAVSHYFKGLKDCSVFGSKEGWAASCHRTDVAERFQTADAALLALRCWHTQAKIISHQALAKSITEEGFILTNSSAPRPPHRLNRDYPAQLMIILNRTE